MTALDDPSSRSFARLAGSLYLLIGFAGVFSIIWVPSQLTVSADPFGTAALIAQRRGLFAAGVGADVVLMLAEVMLSVMLYAMFRSHGHVLALTAAAARLLMVAVMAAMLLPQVGILALVAQDTQFVALDADQRAEIAWVLREIDESGVLVWQAFFTLHLWTLGVLAWRSESVPRLLAAGLAIGGTGYLAASVHAFQFPQIVAPGVVAMILLAVAALSEIGFAIWLLARGRIPARPTGTGERTSA